MKPSNPDINSNLEKGIDIDQIEEKGYVFISCFRCGWYGEGRPSVKWEVYKNGKKTIKKGYLSAKCPYCD
ncbi:hypothetical protein A2954_00755 [Candidatus Roizmanbacteria bacterium RIFCSPLOWO2_01_FULL_37_12]|uniref:Uncharacterized protein n=1 Tax=Candidatus Roizmanbacteria bacterium RIFCSPLOWO2_01_FULL_37_12 TaxID=1802056 RepID=A0A1F7IDS4_9BACT|nr:MAG: hypothetical protein A2954_00755 [Candidatus Roizmanbacteria bacterium RIFCSPLOWO2_01_FULL_37_12]